MSNPSIATGSVVGGGEGGRGAVGVGVGSAPQPIRIKANTSSVSMLLLLNMDINSSMVLCAFSARICVAISSERVQFPMGKGLATGSIS
jgi:hypothetical protein